MQDQPATIDIETQEVPVSEEVNINPILEIGLTEDGKNLACKQLSEFNFNAFMVHGICQVVIDYFKNQVPEDRQADFELTVLELILQNKNYKQEEKPTLISL
jgi:hypothetical protein